MPGTFAFLEGSYITSMKNPIQVAVAAALLLAGCGEKSGQTPSSTNTTNTGSTTNATSTDNNPLNAPANYLGALGKGQQSAIKTVDVQSLQQAIQMFNVDKGRNPKDLNELVEEKFIPQIPKPPYGMKLVYDAESGKVSVVKQ